MTSLLKKPKHNLKLSDQKMVQVMTSLTRQLVVGVHNSLGHFGKFLLGRGSIWSNLQTQCCQHLLARKRIRHFCFVNKCYGCQNTSSSSEEMDTLHLVVTCRSLKHCSLLCFLCGLFPVCVIYILFLPKPVYVSVRQQQLKFQAHLLYSKHCANALQ